MPTTQIKDISTGKLERREQDLLPLSPLVRLLWSSIIDELPTTYDDRPGRPAKEKGCKPVLLLIDEGGRTAIPDLHDAAITVRSRGVSIWLAIQSLEQLSAVYGKDRGNILLGELRHPAFLPAQ